MQPTSNHDTPPASSPPRPQLLFAIASDQPEEVERLLSTGEASVEEPTGSGQGLLEFTVANENLKNKTEIVKILLKYGADPEQLRRSGLHASYEGAEVPAVSPSLAKRLDDGMNPALKYVYADLDAIDITDHLLQVLS